MSKLRIVLFIGIVAVVRLVTPWPAVAQSSWLTVTRCEMVTIDGHEYGKLTFDIHNVFGSMDAILLRSLHGGAPGDTCHLVDFTLPAGWTGVRDPDGRLLWYPTSFASAVPYGGTLAGIQIVLSQPVCCYGLTFWGPLLDLYPEWPVCFACPGATPVRESTWGRLKRTYR